MKSKLIIFVCALLQLTVWAGAQAQPLRKIRIGYPSISSRQAQLWVAKDEGIFRKHGLDVELIFFRGGQVAIQALTGGDPPLVTIGNVIIANLQGHDIVLVGSVENSYDQSVFARPGTMTRIEQLRGKRFGISGFGSATHNAALILFKKFSLEPTKDVTFVPTGTGPERLAAKLSNWHRRLCPSTLFGIGDDLLKEPALLVRRLKAVGFLWNGLLSVTSSHFFEEPFLL
jgi:NitT/TauT family transport system substrate-binding protein